jgi:hypothetical protein
MKNYFKVPRGNGAIRALIKEHEVVQRLSGMVEDTMISREKLCQMIGIDPEPLGSKDPILKDAFTMWFHRYLRILREELAKSEDAGLMLIYPDTYYDADESDDEPAVTGGGPGIALLIAKGPKAVAMILQVRNKSIQLAVKRNLRTVCQLLSDKSGFYGELSRSKRNSIAQALQFAETSLKFMGENSKNTIQHLLSELPPTPEMKMVTYDKENK